MSEFFSSREFACHCGCGFSTPDPTLLTALDELRREMGLPITVLSGCRCIAHNAAVGGTRDSQHIAGTAADVTCAGSMLDFFRAASGIPRFFSGGIGIYPDAGFLHVDVRGTRARWGQLGGEYCDLSTAWSEQKRREGRA